MKRKNRRNILTIYLGLYLFLAGLSISNIWKKDNFGFLAIAIAALLTVFIGLRYYIGVDWITYELIFIDVRSMSLWNALAYGDGAYSLINWVVAKFGGWVWHVNLICALIFSTGLVLFCAKLPKPGLAIATAVPTLIIITAMGYTRQAAALGCIMIAYTQFKGAISWRWMAWLLLAVFFHKSAIVAFPLFALSGTQHRWLTILISAVALSSITLTLLVQNFSSVVALYIGGEMESSGALPRIGIGFLIGMLFFLIKDSGIFGERNLLVRNAAICMIAFLPLYLIFDTSTLIDRFAIIFLPFQCAICAGVVASIDSKGILGPIVNLLLLLVYATILLAWLMFSTYSSYWLPYENILFTETF